MAQRIISKPQIAVRRVIDTLRRDTRLRGFVTLKSEQTLQRLAVMDPERTKPLLKGLLALERLAVPVEKLTVPNALGEGQNKAVLESLASVRVLFKAVDKKGRLDLRRAGVKLKPEVHVAAAPYQPEILEDYLDVLAQNHQELTLDHELGDLFLFKALLRARIDLYREGSLRSARLAEGETIGLTPGLQRLKAFFERLAGDFPFGRAEERLKVSQGLATASRLLEKPNNPAADAALAGLTERLEKGLARQQRQKLRAARGSRGWKVKYQGKGVWQVRQSGYRRAGTGFLRKQAVTNHVGTAELLSMIDHEIESIAEESRRNRTFLKQISFLNKHYPAYWDKLLDVYLEFTKYQSLVKEKACVELRGALELAAINDKKGQARRLARSLLRLAQLDIERRQDELRTQQERFERLTVEAEREIGRQLKSFANSIGADLAGPLVTRNPRILVNVRRRLGGFLGTFMNGTMREPWLKRAKGRVVGANKILGAVVPLVREKQQAMTQVIAARRNFQQGKKRLQGDQRALSELETGLIREVSTLVNRIGGLNTRIVEGSARAAHCLLVAYLDFQKHQLPVVGEGEFLSLDAALQQAIKKGDGDKVEVSTDAGTVLGRLTRADAQALRFKNLSRVLLT